MSGLAPNSLARGIEASPTLAISARAAAMKADGLDVVSLGAGEPDFPAPPPITEAGIQAIQAGDYRYTAAAGTPALRAAGAAWLGTQFGLEYSAAEVMVTAGAKAALHLALSALVEPGDKVLLLAPYWVSYPALVRVAGGEPVVVAPVPEAGFVHTGEAIAAAAQEHGAKGIILNYPNNPSGAVPTRAQLTAIVDAATAAGLWIVADEIYATLLYDDAEHISAAGIAGGKERTVVVSGFTKSHTMTGWRTSFMAAPAALIDACAKMQSQVLGNPCTISQAAMLAACNTPLPDEHTTRMAAFDERRRFLVERINQIPGLTLQSPRGSFYALVDVRTVCERLGIDDVVACSQLLDDHMLAGVPGSAFAIPGFVRLSYAAAMPALAKGVDRLAAWATAN